MVSLRAQFQTLVLAKGPGRGDLLVDVSTQQVICEELQKECRAKLEVAG